MCVRYYKYFCNISMYLSCIVHLHEDGHMSDRNMYEFYSVYKLLLYSYLRFFGSYIISYRKNIWNNRLLMRTEFTMQKISVIERIIKVQSCSRIYYSNVS
jgi:hypothetical protein